MPLSLTRITRLMLVNQMLFTAGWSLTTGGFFNYFGQELGAKGFETALLAATPETVGVLALGSRCFAWRREAIARLCLITSVLARLVMLGVPLLAWPAFRERVGAGPLTLWAILAVGSLFQAVGSVAYHTWLADLIPREEWGRRFFWRYAVHCLIQLAVPMLGAWWRESWKTNLSPAQSTMAYVGVFVLGNALLLAALAPLWWLPRTGPVPTPWPPPWTAFATSLQLVPSRWLLAHAWVLAAANGLTQAVLIRLMFRELHLSLTMFYVCQSAMYLGQMLFAAGTTLEMSWQWQRRTLFCGALFASFAMPYLLGATPDSAVQSMFFAYCFWSGFGAVNLAGQHMMLWHQPHDASAAYAWLRQVAGLIAGLTGLLGGWCLDQLQSAPWQTSWPYLAENPLRAYHVLIGISWVGRLAAAFLVLGIPKTPPVDPPSIATTSGRVGLD